jgi:hypothetical protein
MALHSFRRLVVRSVLAIPAIFAMNAAKAQSLATYDFCFSRGGKELTLTDVLQKLNVRQAAGFVGLGCLLLKTQCDGGTATIVDDSTQISNDMEGNGDDRRGLIRIPDNLELCRAYLDKTNSSVTQNTAFTTTISTDLKKNGLEYTVYAQTHGGFNRGQHEWVKARIYLLMIPQGQRANFACHKLSPSHPWDCKDGFNCTCADDSCKPSIIPRDEVKLCGE